MFPSFLSFWKNSSPGWTLIETTMALLMVSLTLGFTIVLTRGMVQSGLKSQSEVLMHKFRAARSDAVLAGVQTKVYVDPDGGDFGQGRYLAVALPSSQDSSDVASTKWVDLKHNIAFGSGAATTGPFGNSITTAVPLTSFTCASNGICDLGGTPTVLYYLYNTEQPHRVRAVSISESGTSRVYQYNAGINKWE